MFGDDPIEQIRLAVKDLDAEDRRQWSGAVRSDQLVELLEVTERLQAAIVRSVSHWDARADWALDAALGPRTWLTHRASITAVVASKLVRMARLAREHEATGEALRSGDVWCAHVEVLAPMVRHREAEYARNEDALLGAAKSMRADDFGVVARHWRGIANDEMGKLDARTIGDRDRGCVFPGCDRPPAWCNAHHLVWWEHGGLTDEQNLCLLCRRHHTLCHEGGWRLTRNDDGTYQAHEPPPGHTLTTTRTRRHGRAPPPAET